jgi:hypothetical protein
MSDFTVYLEKALTLKSFTNDIEWVGNELSDESCCATIYKLKERVLVEGGMLLFNMFFNNVEKEKGGANIRDNSKQCNMTSLIKSPETLVLVNFRDTISEVSVVEMTLFHSKSCAY